MTKPQFEFRAKTTTRLKLYKEVWAKSLLQLSKKYSMSDRGLAKLCKRYEIPTPPVGYWAKIENGVHTQKTKLPKPSDNPEIIIRPTVKSIKKDVSKKAKPDLKELYKIKNDEAFDFLVDKLKDEASRPKIGIRQDLRGSHPVISKYSKLRKDEKEKDKRSSWYNSYYNTNKYGFKHIRSEKRAKLIMHTVFKEAEARGYKVVEGEYESIRKPKKLT